MTNAGLEWHKSHMNSDMTIQTAVALQNVWPESYLEPHGRLCSNCHFKSVFCAYQTEIWWDLACVSSKKKKKKNAFNAFFTHTFQAAFICGLKSYSNRISGFSLTALIGFHMVYVTFSRHAKCKRQMLGNMLKDAAETRFCCCKVSDEHKMTSEKMNGDQQRRQ